MNTKKILFIAPKYFGYYQLIKNEFKELGYHTDFVPDANDNLMYIISKRNHYLLSIYKKIYCKIVNSYIKNNHYDYIVVIGGKLLSNNEWEKILSSANASNKILYQWDSMKNFDYSSFIPLFDRILTFDRRDSETDNRIEYLPLFYSSNIYKDNNNIRDIDLLFIGIWHSDRLQILEKISEIALQNNKRIFFKLYYPFIPWLWIRLKKGKIMNSKFLTFKKIPLKRVNALYLRSKCILDITNPDQSGITMRTIECIGANKKLLTTNCQIRKESFYTEKNIYIFDRNKPKINFQFIEESVEYPYRAKYHISEWVKHILYHER